MKKLASLFCFVLFSFCFCQPLMAFAQNQDVYVKVIYTSIYVYSQPYFEQANIITELEYGTKLKLKSSSQEVGQDGYNYFLVEINFEEFTEGYVLCSQVLDESLSSPVKDLDHNATLKKNAEEYNALGEGFVKTGKTLNAGEKIKILDGYNSNQKFTRIQYKAESGDIVTAYILTETIKTSGISRTTIGAIIIIVSTISLVLVLFGVKGRKKKTA